MSRRSVLTLLISFFFVGLLWGQDSGMVKLIDFGSGMMGEWTVVNDGVMGGRSSSSINLDETGVAVFEGNLSLENNGGFASVRTDVQEGAFAAASRVLLRVRGDGKRYQLRLRPGKGFDGVAYAAGFGTKAGEWSTVELALDTLEPTYRGFRPRGVGPLDPSTVGQIGIMLADKQEGPFRLEIGWIGVDRRGEVDK